MSEPTPAEYIPRLEMGNIYSNVYYLTYNAYYPRYRMPNCTAYAFGRFNELAQVTGYNTRWPTGNGCDWYVQAPGKGLSTGQVPQLGAAACWWYTDSSGSPSGHVSVVEQINYDSNGVPVSFVTSNSAWWRSDPDDDWSSIGDPEPGFPYFYLETISMSNPGYRPSHPEAYFQGFVYHPDIHPTPTGDPSFIALIPRGSGRSIHYIRRRLF